MTKSWRWLPLLWLALGIVDATETVAMMYSQGMHHNWGLLFAVTVAGWLPWVAATPVILWLERVLPARGARRAAAWAAHAANAALIALSATAWRALLCVWFNPFNDASPPVFSAAWSTRIGGSFLSTFVLYAIALVIHHAIAARERLAEAQLDALRHQIEPHFLFNALNAIAGLTREGRSEAAVSMVVALSDFLRRTLTASTQQEVPLGEEIEFARQYLVVQQVRFGKRLQFDIDVPSDLGKARVPNLILQPLVENAVVHGIAKQMRPGVVRIVASRNERTLTLRVVNDGPPLRATRNAGGTGIGIANVRARLEGLYGGAFSFDVSDRGEGGVEASISLPLRAAHVVGDRR